MSDEALDSEDDETYSAIRTVLGSTHRTARWHLTDEVDVLTALGRSSFDLRLVETTGRPTAEISVTCILGTVTLIVPPGTLVVLDGNSLLARAVSQVEPGEISALPRIEVTATTILGRVKIVSRERETTPAEVLPTATPVVDDPSVEDSPVEDTSVGDPLAEDTPAEDAPAEPLAS